MQDLHTMDDMANEKGGAEATTDSDTKDSEMPQTEEASSSEYATVVQQTSVQAMLDRVAQSDAHFKHQQRGEPDLVYEDKYKIAQEILENKPVTFLSRFGKHLTEDDLDYFVPLKGQYEIDFYMKDIKRHLDDKKNNQKIRNRRFEAMKKLMTDTDYFEDEEMKERNPLLYDQMVGQFLSDDEIKEQTDKVESRISEVFLQHLQGMQNNELFDRMQDIEEAQREESDDDEEEEESESEMEDENTEQEEKEKPTISASEKRMLRHEFIRTMQLQFLNGEDKNFDYSEVDENVDYDSLDQRGYDEEEKYFDEEESESLTSHGSLRRQDVEEVEDYEMYEVEEDIRPGLMKPNEKKEDSQNAESDSLAQACQEKCNLEEDADG